MRHQRRHCVHPSDISGDSSTLSESDMAFIDNHSKRLYVTSSDYDWLLGYLGEE
ncbi:MAG: hypothetical protein IKG22_16490 [Atopobiaceae bacterium]|nr:hypothetical protein [Atopobiaceae bacterium]